MGNVARGWLLALGLCTAAHGAPLGTVTIAEGRAHVTRATAIYALGEGVALEEGDILDLEEGALLQFELADGSALSFTARAQALLPAAGAAGKRADLLLASGWSKLSLVSAAQVPALASPQMRLISQNVSYVVSVAAEGTQLFVENGELVPVYAESRPGQPALIRAGDFVAVKPDFGVALGKRAPPAFVAAMPRPYMDKLPARLARLKAKGVEPKREREAGFADVQAAVQRFPAARAALLAQFEPLLKESDFLRELEPALSNYPEWARIVHPEKGRGKSKAKAK